MKSYYTKRFLKRTISLALAFIMIFSGFIPLFEIENVKAAGKLVYPNETQNTLASLFRYFYREYDKENNLVNDPLNPNYYVEGTIDTSAGGETGDGRDIVRMARYKRYISSIVSKEKINLLNNDFEIAFDLSMIDGRYPGDRGMAFAFHNDPRGISAMGGMANSLGVHGYNYNWRNPATGTLFYNRLVYNSLSNAVAIEIDAYKDNYAGKDSDSNFDKPQPSNYPGPHIAIVLPVEDGQVIHEATSWIPRSMMSGYSDRSTLGYEVARPPSTQTMRVRWTKQADNTFKLTYEYWFFGAQKDIPGAEVFSGSKIYTETDVKSIFGSTGDVYFGIYGAALRDDKAETIIAGFVDMRQYKVSYHYKSRALNEDGTWNDAGAVNKLVPETDMKPVTGQALNGDFEVPLPSLSAEFASYKVPTADLTNNPYTPLKAPTLMDPGENYKNIHSFRSVDVGDNTVNKKATIYLVPFKYGSTLAEKSVVHNYVLEVIPKDVKVKIDYVTMIGGTETYRDSVYPVLRLGDEVGVNDKKVYEGYKLDSASDGATFDATKTYFAKKYVEKSATPKYVLESEANPTQTFFKVIYKYVLITPPNKTTVADTTNLTDIEKSAVEAAIRAANPELPTTAVIVIANDGTATVTNAGQPVGTIPGYDLVEKDTIAPEAPTINGPVTEGDTSVSVTLKETGGIVILYADGEEVGRIENPMSTGVTVPTSALIKGKVLTAVQVDVSGNQSPSSNEEIVLGKVIPVSNPPQPTPDGYVRITFEKGTNGILTGTTAYDAKIGIPFSEITVPTVTPNTNYTFKAWEPTFPEIVPNQNTTYTATYTQDASAAPVINVIGDLDKKVTGTGVNGSTITVKFPNGETATTTVENGVWSVDLPAGVDLAVDNKVTATQQEVGKAVSTEAEKIVIANIIYNPTTVPEEYKDDGTGIYVRGTFKPGANGTFGGSIDTVTIYALKGTLFGSLVLPTPQPKTGFKSDDWEPVLPVPTWIITKNADYTALFIAETVSVAPIIAPIGNLDKVINATSLPGSTITEKKIILPNGTEVAIPDNAITVAADGKITIDVTKLPNTVKENGNLIVDAKVYLVAKQDGIDTPSAPATRTVAASVIPIQDLNSVTPDGYTRVIFSPGNNGTFAANTVTTYDIKIGTPFSALTAPTPTPNQGYEINTTTPWSPTLPTGNVVADDGKTYAAQYTQQKSADPVINTPEAGTTKVTGTGVAGSEIFVHFPDGSSQKVTVDNDGIWTATSPTVLTVGQTVNAEQTEPGKIISTTVDKTVENTVVPSAPTLKGPIYEGQNTVTVTPTEVVGKIEIYRGNDKIGEANVTGPGDVVVTLFPNVVLATNDKLTAKHNDGEHTSVPSNEVTVEPTIIEVKDTSIKTPEGYVRVTFDAATGGSFVTNAVTVFDVKIGTQFPEERVPGITEKTGYTFTNWVPALPRVITGEQTIVANYSQEKSNPPAINEPIRVGATTISGTSTGADGTVVTVTFTDGTTLTAEVTGGKWSVDIAGKTLTENETIKASQVEPHKTVSDDATAIVKAKLNPPTIETPADGSVKIIPPIDEDAKTIIITYVTTEGTKVTVTVEKDGNGVWNIIGNTDLTIDEDGVITIPEAIVKDDSAVTATAKDVIGNSSDTATGTAGTPDKTALPPKSVKILLDADDDGVITKAEKGESLTTDIEVGLPDDAKAGDIIQIDTHGDDRPEKTYVLTEADIASGKAVVPGIELPPDGEILTANVTIKDELGNISDKVTDTARMDFIVLAPTIDVPVLGDTTVKVTTKKPGGTVDVYKKNADETLTKIGTATAPSEAGEVTVTLDNDITLAVGDVLVAKQTDPSNNESGPSNEVVVVDKIIPITTENQENPDANRFVKVILDSGENGNFGGDPVVETKEYYVLKDGSVPVADVFTKAGLNPADATGITIVGDFNFDKWDPEATGNVTGDSTYTATYVAKGTSEAPSITQPVVGDTKVEGTGVTGATIKVTVPWQTDPIEVIVVDGKWSIDVPAATPLQSGQEVKATQTEPGKLPSTEVSKTVTAAPKSEKPTVNKITEGDNKITGEGIPGATVTVKLPDGTELETTVDEDGNWSVDIPADKPVKKGDTVTVTQKEDDKDPSDPVTVTVVGKDAPVQPGKSTPPTIDTPTEGDKAIGGTGIPGATVEVRLPDGTIKRCTVDSDGNWTIPIDVPLRAGEEVSARQIENGKLASDWVRKIVDRALTPEPTPTPIDPWFILGGYGESTPSKPTLKTELHKTYIKGYPEGDFRPEGNITRAEVAAIFERLFEARGTNANNAAAFNDVKAGDWYYDAVTFMTRNGYMSGYPDGTFKPNEPITRAEIVTVLARYKEVAGIASAASVLSDVNSGHWAFNELQTAVEKGWLKGYEDNSLKPDANLTRAEAVTLINRALERYADKNYVDNNPALLKQFSDISGHWAFYDIREASNSHYFVRNSDRTESWDRVVD